MKVVMQMAFCKNTSQQMGMSDPLFQLTVETGHKNDTIYRSQEKNVGSKLNKLTAYIYTEIHLIPFVGSMYRHIRRLKVGKSHRRRFANRLHKMDYYVNRKVRSYEGK